MTNDASILGNRILAIANGRADTASQVCADVRRTIDRMQARIEELEREDTEHLRQALVWHDWMTAARKERDAALARVGEWVKTMPRCESHGCGAPATVLVLGTAEGVLTSIELRLCDGCGKRAHSWTDFPYAYLIRAATGGAPL